MRIGQKETDGLGKSASKHPFGAKGARLSLLLDEWDTSLLSNYEG